MSSEHQKWIAKPVAMRVPPVFFYLADRLIKAGNVKSHVEIYATAVGLLATRHGLLPEPLSTYKDDDGAVIPLKEIARVVGLYSYNHGPFVHATLITAKGGEHPITWRNEKQAHEQFGILSSYTAIKKQLPDLLE
jgi:hypothetical protein